MRTGGKKIKQKIEPATGVVVLDMKVTAIKLKDAEEPRWGPAIFR